VRGANYEKLLRKAGLRPTRQRLDICGLLFDQQSSHVTAEELFEEALRRELAVSLATIYNTLNQFVALSLIRILAVGDKKTYYDTNTIDHHHFIFENSLEIFDAPSTNCPIHLHSGVPSGFEITHVDVLIRVKPARSSGEERG